jgi:glutamate-1-semialdehyde 2,1-aminomutase
MGGLFLSDEPPTTYRDWAKTDYTFYEALAPELHEQGIICEPDSREPLFICEAHDQSCLDTTLEAFEQAVETTINALGDRKQDVAG